MVVAGCPTSREREREREGEREKREREGEGEWGTDGILCCMQRVSYMNNILGQSEQGAPGAGGCGGIGGEGWGFGPGDGEGLGGGTYGTDVGTSQTKRIKWNGMERHGSAEG